MQMFSKFIKGIKTFNLIQDGDSVAIGLSGGKDSLTLAGHLPFPAPLVQGLSPLNPWSGLSASRCFRFLFVVWCLAYFTQIENESTHLHPSKTTGQGRPTYSIISTCYARI